MDESKTYIGRPCKHGHSGVRWKSNGQCVECKRSLARQYYQDNKDSMQAGHADWMDNNRVRMAWLGARRRATEKDVPFTITLEDLPDVPATCPVLGIPLSFGKDTPRGYSPSLDRMIPHLGYVPGNVHWISDRANTIKNNATPAELRMVADYFTSLEVL